MPPDSEPQADQHRCALLLEYDGNSYSGSQFQENAPTVQAALESAIEKVTGETVRVAFAGRTDAGTHARGQTASFLTASQLTNEVIQKALNARLPADVVVRAVADVDLGFDVRRDATRRSYRYSVTTGDVRPALDRDQTWYVRGRLDAEAMALAAGRLLGKRNFAAFSGPLERSDASTVRNLERFDVQAEGAMVFFLLVSNAFLPHQVRRMVGALVEVGQGKISIEKYVALLDGPPSSSRPTAPTGGLCLMSVEYEKSPFRDGPGLLPLETLEGVDSDAYVC